MAVIDKRTLADKVFESLRERILGGDLASDSPIRQEAIAEELNVSKIPVREALARLEQEGLVSSHPHRGFIVRALSAEEAQDVFDLRLKIEPELAGHGAAQAEAADHVRAQTALAALNAELKAAGPSAGQLNRDFHMALVRPAARPISIQILKRLHGLSERYVRVHLGPNGRDERATREHTELLEAWLAGRSEDVRNAAKAHIEATLEDLNEQLSVSGR